MKMIIRGRLYNCPNSSLNVRVLNIYYTDAVKVKCKLQFETRDGIIYEKKGYSLILDNIQHWVQVQY